MAKKGKPLERNWISSYSSTKQRPKDYVKARIDKTQQNSQCRLCSDRDKTINHIISECSEFAQESIIRYTAWWGRGSTGNHARSLNLTNKQMVCSQPIIHPRKWDAQTSLAFRNTNGSPNFGQAIVNNKKKRTCGRYRPGRLPSKIEGRRKKRYVPGPCSGIEKKLSVMKVTVMSSVIKGLELEIRTRVETIKQHYQDRSEYREESWRLEETCCDSNFIERSSAVASVKSSPTSIIIMTTIIIIIIYSLRVFRIS